MENPFTFYGASLRVGGRDVPYRSVTLEIGGLQPQPDLSDPAGPSMLQMGVEEVKVEVELEPWARGLLDNKKTNEAWQVLLDCINHVSERTPMRLQPLSYEYVAHIHVFGGTITVVKVGSKPPGIALPAVAAIGYSLCCPDDPFDPERGIRIARQRLDLVLHPDRRGRDPLLAHMGGRPNLCWLGWAGTRWLYGLTTDTTCVFVDESGTDRRPPVLEVEDAIEAIGGVPACRNCGVLSPTIRQYTHIEESVKLDQNMQVSPTTASGRFERKPLVCQTCGSDPRSNEKWEHPERWLERRTQSRRTGKRDPEDG